MDFTVLTILAIPVVFSVFAFLLTWDTKNLRQDGTSQDDRGPQPPRH